METAPTSPTSAAPAPRAATRRPSGEPPPLPRSVDRTVRASGALLVACLALWAAMATRAGMRAVTSVDLVVVRAVVGERGASTSDVAAAVVDVSEQALFPALAWTVLLALVVARRFQHLLATLALLLVTPVVVVAVRELLGRMRPAGVQILADWSGYAHPSRPVAETALALTLVALVVVPPGRWRTRATAVGAAVVVIVVAARLHTAVDHPSDVWPGWPWASPCPCSGCTP